MAGKPSFKPSEDYYFTLYHRRKSSTWYCRIIHKDSGDIIATKSCSTTREDTARAVAGGILATLQLDQLYRDFQTRKKAREDKVYITTAPKLPLLYSYTIPELKTKKAGDYFLAFWDKEKSPYILDKITMGEPLSGKYIYENARYMESIVAKDSTLREIPIKNIMYEDIESFVRRLNKDYKFKPHKGYYVIKSVLDALQSALSWGSVRHICDPISFKKLPIPPKPKSTRGLLSDEEVNKILALPYCALWLEKDGTRRIDTKPRARLSKGAENKEPQPVYLREKLFILLGLFTGARLGELRGLQWKDVDLVNNTISVRQNFVPMDPLKDPKAKSARDVIIPVQLEPVIYDAIQVVKEIGAENPECYVLLNPKDYFKPCSDSISHSWSKVLKAIGISEEERRERHLVFHGTRHRYVTKLIDAGLTPNEAGKLSGHRVIETLAHYADHLTVETRKKAQQALNPKK
ncbi:MAG: site-specific integrase [Rectinemataceae bacterium]